MEKLKKIEEEAKSINKKNSLLQINNIVDNILQTKFGKKTTFYYSMQIQKKQKSIWETIEFIESVDKYEIFREIKQAIIDFQISNNLDIIIFGADSYKLKDKKTVLLNFPFFTQTIIDTWNPDTQIFVIKDLHQQIEELKGKDKKTDVVSHYEKLFDSIIREAIKQNVSDIHILHKENVYYVFFRMDGFFVEQNTYRLKSDDGDGLITYLMRRCATETKGSQFNPDTRLVYQDARISLSDIGNYDARVAFIPDGYTLKHMEVVIRLLKKQLSIDSQKQHFNGKTVVSPYDSLKMLGYFEDDIEILLSMLSKNKGVCVISGITNSGKSTLVNVLLSSIKNRKVGSVEDPIEYFVSNSNFAQHQLFLSEEERLKMDFVDYIKAFKRSDYDVIFVGEWRNHPGLSESIIEQSFAGQLIFTTLHITNSFQIFESLKYMYGVSFESLKSVLLLSWNQLLFPKLCDKCKQTLNGITEKQKLVIKKKMDLSVILDDKSKNKIENFLSESQGMVNTLFQKGTGCSNCNGTGYKGRQVVYDYFVPNYIFWNKLKSYFYSDVLSCAEQHSKSKTKIDIFLELVKNGKFSILDITGNEYVSSLI